MSKTDIRSRTLDVDTQKCVEKSGVSRYEMIIMAAARAREIRHKNRSSQEHGLQHTVVTALLEVQAGDLDPTILLKIK
jgi:DNA-directed RNA polymerase omega subunit